MIKVIWGENWDTLLAADDEGVLRKLMEECVDGEYQTFKANDGAYVREHFFGRYPETKAMVADWTDEEIWALRRGGHDPKKVYAAYTPRSAHRPADGDPREDDQGYGMGTAGEGHNITHQQKAVNAEARLKIRDRLGMPLTDEQATRASSTGRPRTARSSAPARAARGARRQPARASHRGRAAPRRRRSNGARGKRRACQLDDDGVRSDPQRARPRRRSASRRADRPRQVTDVRDEGMFRQLGIYSQVGQLYQPEDAEDFMFYRRTSTARSCRRGSTSPAPSPRGSPRPRRTRTTATTMIPFYIFYSMFGFQRVGDLAWAAGDSRARGFLIGATAGRTTLNGEGLQHEDGHSHLLAAVVPNCRRLRPDVRLRARRDRPRGPTTHVEEQEDVFYYLTVMNENYSQPALPEGAEEGILRGIYLLREGGRGRAARAAARLRRDSA